MPEVLVKILDIFLHLDKNLAFAVTEFGVFTYFFLFAIIFLETGFVVTPFLPGDSLLFAAGAVAATSSLRILLLYFIVCSAAILGDTANYWIGNLIGPKIFETKTRLIKKQHLIRAQEFYEKYGGEAIIVARFIPIVRTFAPFVAGVARMSYPKFVIYNILGGITWVSLFLWGGYFFGNLPFFKANFHFVVLVIIIISLIPMLIEILKFKKTSKVENT